MVVELTNHAITRGRERFNLASRALLRTAQRAFDVGVHSDLIRGELGKWVKEHLIGSCAGTHMRVTGHQAFVFNNQYLVTVLIVPSDMIPKPKPPRLNRPEEDFEEEDLEEDENEHDIR